MYGIIRQKKKTMRGSLFVPVRLFSQLCLAILMASLPVKAQERLLPLTNNPGLYNITEGAKLPVQKDAAHAYLTLPFWDDFSHPGPYPDPARWADHYVFINQTYGVHPKTTGVATFDALDAQGQIYEHIRANNTPYAADKLTSLPIRLDSIFTGEGRMLSPADSVMISFYYQPQGKAGSPANQDSLVLEFLHPGYFDEVLQQEIEPHWRSVWQARGESLTSFTNDTFPYFRRVVIPIEDTAYFYEDFRFRFTNYVSYPQSDPIPNYSGMRSVWNIDYVYLNHGRSSTQTNYYDIAFASAAQPLLRTYTSMPWMHYISNPQAHLRERFQLHMTNLDNRPYNYTYRYFIQDEDRRVLRTYSGGSWVISPFSENGYQNYAPHANPIVIQNPLPLNPAPARTFHVVHAISEGATGDRFTRNDTIVYTQAFSNYFAFDDGTAERINVLNGWDPVRAHRFVAEIPDELVAVQVFFMPVLQGQQENAFHLVVYSSLEPETIIYRSAQPLYTRLEGNRDAFSTYYLQEAVYVDGPFYVGIQQPGYVSSLEASIGIGQDMSMHTSPQLQINIGKGDGWETSVMEGALMLRAVLNQDITTDVAGTLKKDDGLIIYPNPAQGQWINLRLAQGQLPESANIQIFDIRGAAVYSGNVDTRIDISDLPAGIYVLRIQNSSTGTALMQRFIISR